jgi:hypothetical protein
MTYRYALTTGSLKFPYMTAYRVIPRDNAAVNQDHHTGRGHRLGDGGKEKWCGWGLRVSESTRETERPLLDMQHRSRYIFRPRHYLGRGFQTGLSKLSCCSQGRGYQQYSAPRDSRI